MRYLILLLLVLSSQIQATTIDCYSHSKRVYHGISNDVVMNKDLIIISYKTYYDVIFIRNKKAPYCIARNVQF